MANVPEQYGNETRALEAFGFTVEAVDEPYLAVIAMRAKVDGFHARIDLLMTDLTFPRRMHSTSVLDMISAGLEIGIPRIMLNTGYDLTPTSWAVDAAGNRNYFHRHDITPDTPRVLGAPGLPFPKGISVPGCVEVIAGYDRAVLFESYLQQYFPKN